MCETTSRIKTIAKWFDVPQDAPPREHESGGLADAAALIPCAGKIVLVTGASGAGKSTLLRAVRRANRQSSGRRRWIDFAAVRLPNRAVINCLLPLKLEETLAILSRVGLAEAGVLLRRPARLSEGEQFRLRLAVSLCIARRSRRRCVLAIDEFASSLDELTASVVAQALRRMVKASEKFAVIAATGRESLIRSLQPDVVARCDFGVTDVTWSTNPPE